VLKTVIFPLLVGFTGDFVPDCPFKLGFWQFKFWHRFFSLAVPNLVAFLRLLNRKFSEDSKNVLTTFIFSLQAGLTNYFVSDCQTVVKSCKSGSRHFFFAVFDANCFSEIYDSYFDCLGKLFSKNHVISLTNVKICPEFVRITVFETRRVYEIYDSYFDNCQFVNVNYKLFK